MESNKEKILKTLKDFGRLPSGRLSAITGINYYILIDLLKELQLEQKIKGYEFPAGNYWELKA